MAAFMCEGDKKNGRTKKSWSGVGKAKSLSLGLGGSAGDKTDRGLRRGAGKIGWAVAAAGA